MNEDNHEPRELRSDETAAVAKLRKKLSEKFDEIASVIAQIFGYDPDALSSEERKEIEAITEDACENWDEAQTAAFAGRQSTLTAHSASLKRLLREYQDLADAISDRDVVARDLAG